MQHLEESIGFVLAELSIGGGDENERARYARNRPSDTLSSNASMLQVHRQLTRLVSSFSYL